MTKENEILGRCVGVYKNLWKVEVNKKTYLAHINNSYRHQELPTVGDYVFLHIDEKNDVSIIRDLQERKTELSRGLENQKMQVLAANVDTIFIVTSMNKEFKIGKLERLAIIAKQSGAKICFVLTKKDQCNDCDFFVEILKKRFPNYPVVMTAQNNQDEIEQLKKYWGPDETAIFIGSSGVGKSTLINKLSSEELAKTSEIREKDSKGRHTTSSREMYALKDDRIVIDTPGIRSVGVINDDCEIDQTFVQISQLKDYCHFNDCTHTNEPQCAVLLAIDNDLIAKDEYERYIKLSKKEESRRITKGEANLSKYEAARTLKRRKKEGRNRR